MIAPPYTDNPDLDAFLYNVYLNGTDSSGVSGLNPNTTTGEITDSEGNVVGYLYQFIHVKYADSNTGLNISDTQTGKSYYGIHNSNTSTESTNPADYTWYEVVGTFGTTKSLYYYVLGGRQVKFDVNTDPQDYHWLVDTGIAINLDLIVPPKTITTSELIDAAVTEIKLANAAVTASKTSIAAISNATGDLVANSVGTTQITDNAITSEKVIANAIVAGKIAANAVTAVAIEANAITANKIAADAVTADKIAANSVTAVKIAANAVTADKVLANSISASKMVTNTITAASSIIADAAITNAKISDAAITNAKISNAAVSTLSIAGNAVTVPVSSFASGNSASVTFTVPPEAAGQPVSIIVTWYYVQISWFRGYIYRDGSLIFNRLMSRSFGGVNPFMPITATFIDYPPVGTHTYSLGSSYDDGNTVVPEATALYAILSKR